MILRAMQCLRISCCEIFSSEDAAAFRLAFRRTRRAEAKGFLPTYFSSRCFVSWVSCPEVHYWYIAVMLSCIPQRPRPRPAPIPKKRSWNLPDQYPTCEFCTLSGQWMNREKALLACLDQGGVGATGLFDKKDFDTVYRNAIPLHKAFARLQAPPIPISGIVNVP